MDEENKGAAMVLKGRVINKFYREGNNLSRSKGPQGGKIKEKREHWTPCKQIRC